MKRLLLPALVLLSAPVFGMEFQGGEDGSSQMPVSLNRAQVVALGVMGIGEAYSREESRGDLLKCNFDLQSIFNSLMSEWLEKSGMSEERMNLVQFVGNSIFKKQPVDGSSLVVAFEAIDLKPFVLVLPDRSKKDDEFVQKIVAVTKELCKKNRAYADEFAKSDKVQALKDKLGLTSEEVAKVANVYTATIINTMVIDELIHEFQSMQAPLVMCNNIIDLFSKDEALEGAKAA